MVEKNIMRLNLSKVIILSNHLVGCRHLPTKQALNSIKSGKGYERIIREILRRSGYFKRHYENICSDDPYLQESFPFFKGQGLCKLTLR